MTEQKLELKDIVVKLAEQVSTLTSKVEELKLQKMADISLAVDITGTNDKSIISFVRSIYTKKKYNKGGRIRSIKVDRLETTKGGHTKVFITKTLDDGTIKSHPIIRWNK